MSSALTTRALRQLGVIALIVTTASAGAAEPAKSPPGPARPALTSPKGANTMSSFFLAQTKKEGCPVEVRLNDVPVEALTSPGSESGGTQVNMWIRPGLNRVRVVGTLPLGATPLPGAGSVRILKLRKDQDPQQAQSVATLTWKADGTSRLDEVHAFTVQDAPPTELWTRARPAPLDEGARRAILAVVGRLHQALAGRDLDGALALLDFKGIDVGRSMYLAAEEARASQRDFLEGMMGEAGWKAEPLDPSKVTLEPMADGLLVRASLAGEPVLRVSIGAAWFSLPVYLGNLGGAWVVVR